MVRQVNRQRQVVRQVVTCVCAWQAGDRVGDREGWGTQGEKKEN